MNDGYDPPVQQSNRDEAILTTIFPIILDGQDLAHEQSLAAPKIDPVLAQIALAFGFVPFKTHHNCNYIRNDSKPNGADFWQIVHTHEGILKLSG